MDCRRLCRSAPKSARKRGGGWGYKDNPQGDTSQTQYPTMGLWLAMNNGLRVPEASIERTCAWLLRTQDPTGAWGYQGRDPGSYQRVSQDEVRPSTAAAGLGSLYISADMLGFQRRHVVSARPAGLAPCDADICNPPSSAVRAFP